MDATSYEPLLRTLRRHASLRRSGTPAPTVVVGPAPAVDAALRVLLGIELRDPSADLESLAEAALACARDADVLGELLGVAAQVLDDAPGLRARWARLGGGERLAVIEALRDVGHADLADCLAIEDATTSSSARVEAATHLARLSRTGEIELAALGLRITSAIDGSLAAALDLAERVPRLPVFLALQNDVLDAALLQHRGTRRAALLQQGTVRLGHTSAMAAAPFSSDAIDRIRAEIAARPDDRELLELARSLAERILHDALEARASTQGRYELNGRMPFRFGPRACEIDLCDRRTRIAIEIDGYHHFTSPDAYRRDRRKDVLLQREGFVVLRFLDRDIFDRLDFVLQVIDEVQYHRVTTGHEGG